MQPVPALGPAPRHRKAAQHQELIIGMLRDATVSRMVVPCVDADSHTRPQSSAASRLLIRLTRAADTPIVERHMGRFRHPHARRGFIYTSKGAFAVVRGIVEVPNDVGEAFGW